MLIGTLSALALAGAGWAWFDRQRVDPWTRQMSRLRRTLAMLGVAAALHESPRTLAARLRSELRADGGAAPGNDMATLALSMAALLDRLDAQRYGRHAIARPDATLTRHFTALARRLAARRRAARQTLREGAAA